MASSKQILDLITTKRPGMLYDNLDQAIFNVGSLDLDFGSTITTQSFRTTNDNGGSTYTKVELEPSHDGKFQDIFGFWWELNNTFIRPEMFGAKGDGVTDDTDNIKKAMNILRPGQAIVLTAGKTYCVQEFIFLDKRGINSLNGTGVVCYDGLATIKKIGDASTHLATTESWLRPAPSTTSQYWPYAEGINFDGNSLADHSYIGIAWRAKFIRCTFTGGLISGCCLTEVTRDGLTTTGSQGNTIFIECQFTGNTGDGLQSINVEDTVIHAGFSSSNGGFGLQGRIGGWRVIGFKIYGCTLGPFKITNFGYGTVLSGCHFDLPGDAWFSGIQATTNTGRLMNCDFKCGLRISGNSGVIVLDSPRFQTENGHLLVDSTGNLKIIIQGGLGDANNVIRYSNTATGIVETDKFYLSTKNGFLSGYLVPPPTGFKDADIAPNFVRFNKTLNANTSTTLEIKVLLPNVQAAGSILTVDCGITTYQNTFADYETYQSTTKAAITRRVDNSLVGNHANVVIESTSATSLINSSASWAVTGGSSETREATLTILFNHATPTAATNTILTAEVKANHRLVTSMTVT